MTATGSGLSQAGKCAFYCLCFRFLVDGVEYAMVLPTLFKYLEVHFATNVSYVGIVLAAYSIGGLISAPIIGPIADKIGSAKGIIIFGCTLSFIGNIIYVIAPTKQWVAAARFIAGINVDPLILAEIGKCSSLTATERSRHISIVFVSRQVGVLLGPLSVVIFAQLATTNFYGIEISQYNSIGIWASALYLISTLSFIFVYDPKLLQQPDLDNSSSLQEVSKLDSTNDTSLDKTQLAKLSQVLLYEPNVLALVGTYVTMFHQAAIEAVLGPATEYLFAWTQVEISFLFLLVGITAIIGFILTTLRVVLKYTGGISGNILLGSVFSLLIFYSLFFSSFYVQPSDKAWAMPVFLITTSIYVLFMPFVITGTASLLTLASPKHIQSTVQSTRTICGQISLTLGAYCTTQLYIRYGLTGALIMPCIHSTLLLVLTICARKATRQVHLERFAKLLQFAT